LTFSDVSGILKASDGLTLGCCYCIPIPMPGKKPPPWNGNMMFYLINLTILTLSFVPSVREGLVHLLLDIRHHLHRLSARIVVGSHILMRSVHLTRCELRDEVHLLTFHVTEVVLHGVWFRHTLIQVDHMKSDGLH